MNPNNAQQHDLLNEPILPHSPNLSRGPSYIPVNRNSITVRQNMVSEMGRSIYDSISYLSTGSAFSAFKIIASLIILYNTPKSCNQPLESFIRLMIYHDILFCALLTLKLFILLRTYDSLQRNIDLEAQNPASPLHEPLSEMSPRHRRRRNTDYEDVFYNWENLQVKLRYVEMLNFLLTVFYVFLFVYGQILYFNAESDCAEVAPWLNRLTFLYICLGYIALGGPILFMLIACFCLPCILYTTFFVKRGPDAANKKIIDKLPVMEYKKAEHGQCEECSICMLEYHEGDKVICLECSALHIFHEECLKRWLKINGNCPICRERVDKSQNKPQEMIEIRNDP